MEINHGREKVEGISRCPWVIPCGRAFRTETSRECLGGCGTFRAFSLLEVMVSTVILAVILVAVFSAIHSVSEVWRRTSNRIEAFQGARMAFESLTANLGQATLNTYLDVDDQDNPRRYLRKSDLKFSCGQAETLLPSVPANGQAVFFQMPSGHVENWDAYGGMESLLNTCGYFVAYGSDPSVPPHVPNTSPAYRYRLMQMLVPREENTIYTALGDQWFADHLNQAASVADNIVALIILPQDPGSIPADLPGGYSYDSSLDWDADPQPVAANQLPPVLQITLIAIDETSAARICDKNSPPQAIEAILEGRFTDPEKYQADLKDVTEELSEVNIGYQVFSTSIPLRESKWTKSTNAL